MRFYKCVLCGSAEGYDSIEGWLGGNLSESGFAYKLSDFETLSYKKYHCKKCGASDRDRLYALFIKKMLLRKHSNQKLELVDFAPSKALSVYLKGLADITYRSADLFMDGVDDKIDITNMDKYDDASFDFFVCSHILEHVGSDTDALNELYRILKDNGSGILMTPLIDKPGAMDEDPGVTDEQERIRRFAQGDHVRLYEKSEFMRRVKSVGFRVETITGMHVGLVTWLRNGLTLKSRLYIVHKDSRV